MANEQNRKPRLYQLMRCGFAAEPLEVTENGDYDVSNYSIVSVNVAQGEEVIEHQDPLTFEEYQSLVDNGSIVKDGKTITLDTSGNTTYLVEI